eukprot:scaffold1803_cov92-Amphora_coffeaeformis.AAC.62
MLRHQKAKGHQFDPVFFLRTNVQSCTPRLRKTRLSTAKMDDIGYGKLPPSKTETPLSDDESCEVGGRRKGSCQAFGRIKYPRVFLGVKLFEEEEEEKKKKKKKNFIIPAAIRV